MKRKREVWDYGETYHLHNTDRERLEDNLLPQDMGPLKIIPSAPVANNMLLPPPECMQHKRTIFRIVKDKRQQLEAGINSSNEDKNGKGECIIRDIELFLPDFLRETLWSRHEYSLDDVLCTLNACPKAYIWQLALYYNIQILNSASKPSWSSSSIIYGGKSSAIKRMTKEFQKPTSPMSEWKRRPSTLLRCNAYYKQPLYLPFHWVTPQTMETLLQYLPESVTSSNGPNNNKPGESSLGQAIRHYSQYLVWRPRATDEEVHLVPMAIYWHVLPRYDFMLFNRVAPYEAYCKRYKQNTNQTPLSEWMDMVYINNVRYALLDEAFYVVALRK